MDALTQEEIDALATGKFATYGEELNLNIGTGEMYGRCVGLSGDALEQLARRYLALRSSLLAVRPIVAGEALGRSPDCAIGVALAVIDKALED